MAVAPRRRHELIVRLNVLIPAWFRFCQQLCEHLLSRFDIQLCHGQIVGCGYDKELSLQTYPRGKRLAKFIIGGYSNEVTVILEEQLCRVVQEAVLQSLAQGKSFYFRSGGKRDGVTQIGVIWISPSSPVRFEYDTDILLDAKDDLVSNLLEDINGAGGIVLPSDAEIELWQAQYRELKEQANH